jgi:hypothetical protein
VFLAAIETARAVVLGWPFLVDKLDNRRHQVRGNHNKGLVFIIKGSFDFRALLGFSLIIVVLCQLADARFVPSEWILLFLIFDLVHFFFLRCRRRNPELQIFTTEPILNKGKELFGVIKDSVQMARSKLLKCVYLKKLPLFFPRTKW